MNMNSFKAFQVASKLRQCTPAAITTKTRCLAQKVTPQSTGESRPKFDANSEINNEPINYFGSQAASWRARDTRSGGADDELWYQPYVISGSLAIFLLYFCVFREESDIDRKLESNLFDHVPALEEVQLTVNYKYNKDHGLDNREVIRRLTEMGVDIKELDIKMS